MRIIIVNRQPAEQQAEAEPTSAAIAVWAMSAGHWQAATALQAAASATVVTAGCEDPLMELRFLPAAGHVKFTAFESCCSSFSVAITLKKRCVSIMTLT